jgi:hypothetical protein
VQTNWDKAAEYCRKKARDVPLKKPLIEISFQPVKRRQSTLDDINSGTNLVPSKKRRIWLATAIGVSSFKANRSVFPVQVKLCALDGIAKEDTHTAVARRQWPSAHQTQIAVDLDPS